MQWARSFGRWNRRAPGPPIADDGPERENEASAQDIASFTRALRTFVATVTDEYQVYARLAGVAPQIARRISASVLQPFVAPSP